MPDRLGANLFVFVQYVSAPCCVENYLQSWIFLATQKASQKVILYNILTVLTKKEEVLNKLKGSPLTLSMESIYAYENENCEVLHIYRICTCTVQCTYILLGDLCAVKRDIAAH